MATSTLRAVILVAAVAVGVVAIARAFDGNPSEVVTTPTNATSPTSPSPDGTTPTTPRTTTPTTGASPRVQGIIVQVRNGTNTTGLAGTTSESLRAQGYTVTEPQNSENTDTTTVYFQPGFMIEAQYLQQRSFPDARLEPATDAFPTEVNIIVILGADYSPA